MNGPPFRSALLRGHVVHQRTEPLRHAFRYPVSYFLFDVDELPLLDRKLNGFGYNRWRAVSLFDADYDRPPHLPLRASIEAYLARHGRPFVPERIELLTQPRICGYVFNPVSYFYCFGPGDELRCVVAEVNNTFGDRIRYLLDAGKLVASRYRQPKEMHVSPFMPMNLEYWWAFQREGDRLSVRVDETNAGELFFHAALTGRLRPLTSAELRGALWRFPLMPFQISTLIYWQALRLSMKRAPFWSRPEYERPVL